MAYLFMFLLTGRNFPISMFAAISSGIYFLILFNNKYRSAKKLIIPTIIFAISILLSISMFWFNLASRTHRVAGQEAYIFTAAEMIEELEELEELEEQRPNDLEYIRFYDLIISESHIARWEIMNNLPGFTALPNSFAYVDPNDPVLRVLPHSIQFLYIMGTSYFTQGYHGISVALRTPHQWTFGVGHSGFLMPIFGRITGVDLLMRTYTYRMRNTEPYVVSQFAWVSGYTEFANDLTFFGLIMFIGLAGAFLFVLWIDALSGKNLFAVILFIFVMMIILTLPLTNFVLNSGTNAITFYVTMILYIASKIKGITFNKKGKQAL